VLDDEVQVRERGSRVVDVFGVERVFVERPDSRAFVDVDVGNAQLLALLQITLGLRVLEAPALRTVLPLRSVELDPFEAIFLVLAFELPEALLAVSGIEAAVQGELIGVLLRQNGVPLGGVEAFLVPRLLPPAPDALGPRITPFGAQPGASPHLRRIV